MGRIIYTDTRAVKSWRDKLAEIKAAEQTYREYYSIMTPMEREVNRKEVSKITSQYAPAITQGVLQLHENALQKLKRADQKVKQEKRKEIASWEAARLAAEMQVYEMLIDHAVHTEPGKSDFRETTAQRIEKIINEAKASGDKYKQRAAAEVLKAALSNTSGLDDDARLQVNHMAQQSKAELEKIRTTPELEAAYEEAQAVYDEYRAVRDEVARTSKDIGEGDPYHPLSISPFTKALKRVRWEGEELKIYDADDPEVTGVYPKSEKHEAQMKQGA